MRIYDSNDSTTYHNMDKSKFKEIEYKELISLIETYGFEGYYGFQGIEQEGCFAKLFLDPHTPTKHILYDSLAESKYVEYYLKRDFGKKLNIIPVPDNYTDHISKTSIAVSYICKDMLDNLKLDNMSYEDVIYGLMAQLYYLE